MAVGGPLTLTLLTAAAANTANAARFFVPSSCRTLGLRLLGCLAGNLEVSEKYIL